MNRTFVHANRHLPSFQAIELLHPLVNFFAQIQHPVRILEQQRAGVRQRTSTGAAHE